MSRYKDADAMIQELKRQYMFLFGTEEIPSGIGMFIENFPTADVAPIVHGDWIPIDIGDCCYRCSVCNFVRDAYLLEEDNYCPHCGARMDGER